MAVAADPTVAAVGPRVKALREAMDLSLRDLAERSGVSAPMLSQVERGETSPTLQVASRIASGLELRLSQLLRLDEEGTVSVVRRGEGRRGGARRPRLRGAHAAAAGPARRGHAPHARPRRRHRRPGRSAAPRARRPRDRRRRARRADADVDGAEHELCAGDCVTFDADLPHHFDNHSERRRPSCWPIVSAGLRRS